MIDLFPNWHETLTRLVQIAIAFLLTLRPQAEAAAQPRVLQDWITQSH